VWFFIWLALSFLVWSLGLEPDAPSVLEGLSNALHEGDLDAVALELAAVSVALLLAIVLRSAFPLHTSSRTADKARTRTRWYRAIDVGLWLTSGWLLVRTVMAGSPSPLEQISSALQRSPGTALIVLLVAAGNAAYTSRPHEWTDVSVGRKAAFAGRVALGLYCGSLHFICWLLAATLFAKVTILAPIWIPVTAALGGLASMLLFACGLWFAGQYERALLNDAFSAIGVEDYKNFLRIRIAPDGKLTVFAIGLEKVVQRWDIHRATGGGREEPPYICPADGERLTPHLIERIELS
jgi:hypothetical protein